jgi:LAO/AO transport system kinase
MSDKKKHDERFPDWAPENAGRTFASRVVSGKKNMVSTDTNTSTHTKSDNKKKNDIEQLYNGVIASDRTALSKAITLVESNSIKHFHHAQELITKLIPHSGKSIRIGITGVPGAGKSTFIEAFGTWLIEQGHKVAVLAIDPSSTISKGSILGDKTRMEKLSRLEESFIRPSPSSGVLGGVARKTRETIILCEAAGYDVILIETVGVGQSEVTVRSIVDFFMLLQITGAGDDLQGIKKGVIELADLIVVNKADGENEHKAEVTKSELMQVLHYIQPITQDWKTPALVCSSLTGKNIPLIWDTIAQFIKLTQANCTFKSRRDKQQLEWMNSLLSESLTRQFFDNETLVLEYNNYKQMILTGRVTPTLAVDKLMESFRAKLNQLT